MDRPLKRPLPLFDPAKGLLSNDHYQISYATNDLDRAVAVFRDRFNVPAFRNGDAELPGGGVIRIRSSWIGNMAYEIICASGPGTELYTESLPATGFALKHHHYAYLLPDEAAWRALEQEVERGGWVVRQKGGDLGFGLALTLEAPELGHYLEFVMPGPGLIARLEATPGW